MDKPHIYISAMRGKKVYGYEEANMNFSLHEDFNDMKMMIKKLNPKVAVMVHCATPFLETDATIEQEVLNDAECRTQFIFAEESEIYIL